jgi:hypothetical protein
LALVLIQKTSVRAREGFAFPASFQSALNAATSVIASILVASVTRIYGVSTPCAIKIVITETTHQPAECNALV